MTQPDMSKCEEIFATLVKKSVLTGGRKKKGLRGLGGCFISTSLHG